MAIKEYFSIPRSYRMWSLALMGAGVLSLIIGYILYGTGTGEEPNRFWAALLQNSTYFLLITNAAMFFICAVTLAMGSWAMTHRRVTEAISAAVIPVGFIAFIVLMCLLFVPNAHVYHWLHPHGDPILEGKTGFLNKGFFITWTVLTIGLWMILGRKMRLLSRELDNNPLPNAEAGKRYIFKNTVWASIYIVWFALTVMSVTIWLWLMSVDAHWYSTMYSWYNFASTFVAGLALITIFVVYLKNKDYLEYTNEEHLHDLGKFIFAFSIFWAYLWFAQYMLIWYANIPEETIYFKPRITSRNYSGAYTGVYWFMFIINFLAPLLILMRRGSKRNYTTMTFMCVLLLFGHWLDSYQQVYASLFQEHVTISLFEFGIAAGFVGVIMWTVGNVLSKYPLLGKNHPYMKESIIHHS